VLIEGNNNKKKKSNNNNNNSSNSFFVGRKFGSLHQSQLSVVKAGHLHFIPTFISDGRLI
jgi:hypothetical protein